MFSLVKKKPLEPWDNLKKIHYQRCLVNTTNDQGFESQYLKFGFRFESLKIREKIYPKSVRMSFSSSSRILGSLASSSQTRDLPQEYMSMEDTNEKRPSGVVS